MDIKEIALKVADSLRNKVDGISHMQSNQGLVAFAEALIESYKAELLKEVGEPVGYVFKDDATRNFYNSRIGSANEYGNYAQPLFTSDQVAAAIVKATKPLEYQLAKAEQRVAEYNELIYAVQTKHHDETRHQTALRYIRNAENRQSYTAANGASS